jgi:MYXO-CTERM domain-containing protein
VSTRGIFAVLTPWLVVAGAGEAAAGDPVCTPDPCAEATAFVGLDRVGAEQEIEIPTDGVVVMRAQWFGEFEPDVLRAGLSLRVGLAGAAIAGEVEWLDDLPGMSNVLLWRPAAPLEPNATYEVEGEFINPEGVPGECAPAVVDLAFAFTTTHGPAEPLPRPTIYSSSGYSDGPVYELGSLICCDGAMPVEQVVCGIDQGIDWSEGACVSATVQGRISVEIGVASVLDDASSGQWIRSLYEDGERVSTTLSQKFSRSLREPACFTVEQRSLATGEGYFSEIRCFGDDITRPLGDVRVNPVDALADLCEGDPYVCGGDGAAWSPDRCVPWALTPGPADDAEAGCGCAAGDPGGPVALVGAGLLVVRRRRRG